MAIRDLLWACPICGREGGIESARRAEVCRGCTTWFRRGKGSTITARRPGHAPITLRPTEWLDQLPELKVEERIRRAETRAGVILSAPAILRIQEGYEPISFRGTYLNRIERLGPPRAGVLRLLADRIDFLPDGWKDEGGSAATEALPSPAADRTTSPGSDPLTWPFAELTAIQPSSSTLQFKARGLPLASVKVPGGSIRFWEELTCAALQHYYRLHGYGEIIEFQPRIATRRMP